MLIFSDATVKRQCCKRCFSVMIPLQTATLTGSSHVHKLTCNACGYVKIIPIPKLVTERVIKPIHIATGQIVEPGAPKLSELSDEATIIVHNLEMSID